MKFLLPDGCVALSHEGAPVPATPDGIVEAEATHAAAFAVHGILPVPASPPAGKARPEVIRPERPAERR